MNLRTDPMINNQCGNYYVWAADLSHNSMYYVRPTAVAVLESRVAARNYNTEHKPLIQT